MGTKVYIGEIMFGTMLKAVKNGVAKDSFRPEYNFMKVKVEGTTVTVYTCDGYTGAKMTLKARRTEGEDFECYIKPIPFKARKNGVGEVVLSLEEDNAILELPTEYGTLTYRFKQTIKWSFDADKIFSNMESHDREVGINTALMARIMRNFASVSSDRNKLAIIESKENNKQGFRIRAKDKEFTLEQFIMPVRINDGERYSRVKP